MGADIAILGSGIIGSTCALILRRAGYHVQLIDQGTHPRFALGESTLPPTSFWMTLLAHRWKVPELHTVSVAAKINERVTASCGVKKNFGFVYHNPAQDSHVKAWHVPIPEGKDGKAGESHLFRQDVDAYLFYSAIESGVEAFSATNIVALEEFDKGIRLKATDGRQFEARFVIDASGYRSVLSEHFGLRQTPSPLRTQSRSVFTHMVNVKPYDEYYSGPQPSSPWHQGTLHHFFDGGWVWVIPFNNVSSSNNKLCSVGLNLDMRHYPYDPKKPAELEWKEFLEAHPSIAGQFAGAAIARPWVRTGRLQYSNSSCVGPRYWITPHAAGAVDALYSRGMLNAVQATQTGCRLVVEALKDDDFSVDRFKQLDDLHHNSLAIQDTLVFGSYSSLRDPSLLERWLVLWSLLESLSTERVMPALVEYAATDSIDALDLDKESPGQAIRAQEVALPMLQQFAQVMERLEAKQLTLEQTAAAMDQIFSVLKQSYGIDAQAVARGLADVTARHTAPSGLAGGLEKIGLANYS